MTLRQELVNLLTLRQAHMIFEDAVEDFPAHAYNLKPFNLTYSFWHILDHIRLCQVDILAYMTQADYVAPDFPTGYWRAEDAICTDDDWQRTIEQFYADQQALIAIVMNPEADLQAQLPHAQTGHTITREIIIIGQHNAYHLGEFCILRQACDLW